MRVGCGVRCGRVRKDGDFRRGEIAVGTDSSGEYINRIGIFVESSAGTS